MKRDLHGIGPQEKETYVKFIEIWEPSYDYLILRTMVCKQFKEYMPTIYNPDAFLYTYEGWIRALRIYYRALNIMGWCFSINDQGWSLLWKLICEDRDGILSEEQIEAGNCSDSLRISKEQCLKLSERIFEKLDSGYVIEFQLKNNEHSHLLSEKKCSKCDGKGIVLMKNYKEQCSQKCASCNEKGYAPDGYYNFTEEALRLFVLFLKDCGGCEVS